MEHASPRLRSVDEGGYNLRSTQANTTHLSGPDTALDSEIPSNAFATAVPGEEEELVLMEIQEGGKELRSGITLVGRNG